MYINNKTFLAIIIGALIIGGFIYFGLQKTEVSVAPAIKTSPSINTKDTNNYSNIPRNDGIAVNSISNIATSTASCGAAENTIVTKVIDGDTVVVEGGWHIRLLGMDADEKGYPCYDQAKIRLENLILAKKVILEKDVSDVDQYGRCLRYIFLDNTNIDVQMAKEGMAVARFYQPDIKYESQITGAEKYAETNKLGCKWSGASQAVK